MSPTVVIRAAASASSTAASTTFHAGPELKIVGIVLAITSGLLIGSSFVFKKKGLLRAQAGHAAGEGVAYLKSPLWWLGMTMMIMGELCNFAGELRPLTGTRSRRFTPSYGLERTEAYSVHSFHSTPAMPTEVGMLSLWGGRHQAF
ncbi:magnesium transporter NIPA-domain-containing protein [Mycena galopus ATCC 62051]|nr:magnesium transporter NIPA-domain-containing protein [Mycena galopus ATCC 62051]